MVVALAVTAVVVVVVEATLVVAGVVAAIVVDSMGRDGDGRRITISGVGVSRISFFLYYCCK